MGPTAFRALAEMREFATFSGATQRFIKRSLDVAAGKRDAIDVWGRNGDEADAIRRQAVNYARLGEIREAIPDGPEIGASERLMGMLIPVSAHDLAEGRMETFSSYRFLFERLVGVRARPWLPSAFLGAAALPSIDPERRRVLLMSISEAVATAPGWSSHPVEFYPSWVDKVSPMAA